MTFLRASAQTAKRLANLPADCTCNVCGQPIGAYEPRSRCAVTQCDDVHLCDQCCTSMQACPSCGTSSLHMYRDGGSSFVLRTRVFREAFDDAADPAGIVHPQVMVARAFAAYAERPLLGRPDGNESVRWWSYEQCGAAATRFSHKLRSHCLRGSAPVALVVICASNSIGWLLADWACALSGLPSITIDASTPPPTALATARRAAGCRQRSIGVVCVNAEREAEWRDLLSGNGLHAGCPADECMLHSDDDEDGRGGDGDGSCGGRSDGDGYADAAVGVLTTTMAQECLSAPVAAEAHAASAIADAADLAAAEAPRLEVTQTSASADCASCPPSGLVTCLFSFGSTGAPKPLWFSAREWSEWTERNPPVSKRARSALVRRSVRRIAAPTTLPPPPS